MASIKTLKAAKKFGPGYYIKEQMQARGWVQAELAEILGVSTKHLSSIIQNKQALSIENAKNLGLAFNTTPQLWLNIDNNYRLWLMQHKEEQTDIVKTKAMIYSHMPVRDMMKKGWIISTRKTNELEKEVKNYWGIEDLDFSFLEESKIPYYKKSEAYNQFNASYAATWYHKAKQYSESFDTIKYDKTSLKLLYKNIANYTLIEGGIKDFINKLNKCGVKFFILPHLEKTYLDGAAFIHNESPVIVYTARYKRIDNFWFTIAHEIAHIIKHLDKDTPVILDNFKEEAVDKIETEANSMAAKHLLHNKILDYLEDSINYLTVDKVLECSEQLNIHPSIIIGALAHNNSISYRNLSLFNENVLEFVPSEYIHESMNFK